MKCPKCEYLSFEDGDRCRNCGYEFSLASAPLAADRFDVSLSAPLATAPEPERQPLDLNRVIGASSEDLPLFGDPADSTPLITVPSRPRAPLGVRRATPEIPRAKLTTPRPVEETLFERRAGSLSRSASGGSTAAPATRIAAALIDAALLLGLNSTVLYFTLRLCGLSGAELLQLPLTPLVAFFLLLDGGYCVAFTAVGGQSIGKMALGIKVVSDEDRPVPIGRATLRTIAYLLSAIPLGAGFLAGLLGTERLALHDRLAHTRVVGPV